MAADDLNYSQGWRTMSDFLIASKHSGAGAGIKMAVAQCHILFTKKSIGRQKSVMDVKRSKTLMHLTYLPVSAMRKGAANKTDN